MADESTEKSAETPHTKTRASRAESKCSIEGCKRPYRAKTYCNVHYRAWRHGEIEGHTSRYKICTKEGCRKPRSLHGFCAEHAKGDAAAAPAA